jgi:hypothetical protein
MGLNATLYNSTYSQGIVLPIRPGAIFRDEYNEVLDSGVIVISQRTTPIVISPFDVIVVSGDNFVSRRLIVDSVTERIVSFDPLIYDYQVNLFSETKLLENYVCPNLSITQPIDKSKRKSVSFYLTKYLEMYGPNRRRKKILAPTEWEWSPRFVFENATLLFFDGVECPELQWNSPTLREVFTDLMMVADRIPILRNNEISNIDITAVGSAINESSNINFVEKTITSTDAVTQLRLNMENALTPKGDDVDTVTRKVEFVGFRNSNNNVFLDTTNMEIVVDNPIYKLLRVTMFVPLQTLTAGQYVFTEFDITNHCVERSIYESLSTVAKSLSTYFKVETDIGTKQFNVYYSRGGRTISGWGNAVDVGKNLFWTFTEFPYDSIITYILGYRPFGSGVSIDTITGFNRMDTVFRVEYETQGSVVADIGRTYLPNLNERTTFDNQTNAFVDINAQGKFTQLKINRLGNDVLMISGRYDTANLVPVLAQTFNNDYIIFSREISVFDDYVLVKFMAAKNYVLRDYFTGVSSRKRNFLLDTANSFVRHDLAKFFAEFSFVPKFEKRFEAVDAILPVNLIPFNWQLAKAKPIITAGFRTTDFYNNTIFYPNSVLQLFGVDLDKKISGNSLLLTIAAKDNVSVGDKIELRTVGGVARRVQDTYFYANRETGEFYNVFFVLIDDYKIGGNNLDFPFPQQYSFSLPTGARDALISVSREKPLLLNTLISPQDVRKRLPIYKDNKEILKITTQIEFCADNRDIIFTEQFLKLQKFVNEKDYGEIRNFGVVKKSFYKFSSEELGSFSTYPGNDLQPSPFIGFSVFYRLSNGVNLVVKEAVSQLNVNTQLPYWQDYPFTFDATNLSGGSSYAVIHNVGGKYGVWNGRIDNSGFETPHFVEFDDTGVWPDINENYIQLVSTDVGNFTNLAQMTSILPPQNFKGGMIVANVGVVGGGVYFALPVGIFTGPGGSYNGQTWQWVRKDNVITNLLDANRVFVNFQGSTRYRWTGGGFSALITNNLPVGWKIYVGTTSAHRYKEYDVLPKGSDATIVRQVNIVSINSLTSSISLSGSSTGITSWAIADEDNKLLFAVNGNNFVVYLNVLNSRDTRVFDGDVIVGSINNTTNQNYAV